MKPENNKTTYGLNIDGLETNSFPQSNNGKSTKFSQGTQTKNPFVYSKVKTVCPCGEHISFNALTSHATCGKCWNCDKFFKPNNDAVNPNFIQPIQTSNNNSKSTYKRFEREHIYWTNDGDNYLMKIEIFRVEGNKKKCYQYRWEGDLIWDEGKEMNPVGKWIAGLDGVTTTLYNAPIFSAYQNLTLKVPFYVYIVEGEKDVNTLNKHGLIATCNPMGAGNWKDDYSYLLKDLICFVIPDNDNAGRKHAEQVCKSLQGIATSAIIIDLLELMPDLPEKGDVTDFYNMGGKL